MGGGGFRDGRPSVPQGTRGFYTGAPGLCVPELWLLRAWCRASGGVSCAGGFAQRLFDLEGRADLAYRRCAMVSAHARPEYLLDMKPAVVPSASTWMLLVQQHPDVAQSVRDKHERERVDMGVWWDSQHGWWSYDTSTVLTFAWRLPGWGGKFAGERKELEEFREGAGRWPEVISDARSQWQSHRVNEHRLAKKLERIAGQYVRAVTYQWRDRSVREWVALTQGDVGEAPEVVDAALVPLRECRSSVQLYCAEAAPQESEADETDDDGAAEDVGSDESGAHVEDGGSSSGDGPKPWVPIPGGAPITRAAARSKREREQQTREAAARLAIPMLFAAEGLDEKRCRAQCWRARPSVPVFGQCKRCMTSGDFCRSHDDESKRAHGVWDPTDGHATFYKSYPEKYESGLGVARQREEMRRGRQDAGEDAGAPGVDGSGGHEQRGKEKVLYPKISQPPFVPKVPGEFRRFKREPEALPPYPCRLCEGNFGTEATFRTHVSQEHCGWAEYRKRLFHLAGSFEGVRPVTPQEWRLCVEAFTEDLITGTGDWPMCGAERWASWRELPAAEAWWQEGPLETEQGRVPVSPVRLEALGEPPAADSLPQDSTRRRVRCRVPCCVCARLGWESERHFVHLWRQPSESPRQSIIQDVCAPRRRGEEARRTPREEVAEFFAPERYHRRWHFDLRRERISSSSSMAEVVEGGIPLGELEASAVRDPEPGGRLWLLHKKCFRMVSQRRGDDVVEVADPEQLVPICSECRGSLSGQQPKMPKYALANDLWMGKLPVPLGRLSLGSRLLLPLLRGVIRRYNCLTDSGKWRPSDQCIKGFIGNVVAFPQADGGKPVLSLPPSEEALVEYLKIYFVGKSREDFERARVEDFDVTVEEFREAYDFLRSVNEQYARVSWDSVAEEGLRDTSGSLGLPAQLAACVHFEQRAPRRSTVQKGPADAVEGAAAAVEAEAGLDVEDADSVVDEEPDAGELGDFSAAVADADMQCDQDKAWKRVEVGLRRAELAALEKAKSEARVNEGLRHGGNGASGDLLKRYKKRGTRKWKDDDVSLDGGAGTGAVIAEKERPRCSSELDPSGGSATQDDASPETGDVKGVYEDKAGKAALEEEVLELSRAARSLNVGKLRGELHEAEQALEATLPPPGVREETQPSAARASLPMQQCRGRLVVPTGTKAASMFTSGFWSAFDPLAFPYGDGVFGVERDTALSYIEWCRYLLLREELVYESHEEGTDGTKRVAEPALTAKALRCMNAEELEAACELPLPDPRREKVQARLPDGVQGASVRMATEQMRRRLAEAHNLDLDPVPRWRSQRDLITAQYCLWRRKGYIRSARNFVQNQRFADSLRALAEIEPQELFHACEILGKGAGIKEAMASDNVAERVKVALRSMLLCNAQVIGSDAHRTVLRHVHNSYRHLFGPPLIFTTPNPVENRSLVMNLLYEGESVGAWRLLEEHAPPMPAVEEMLRRVARDPAAQAIFFDLMLRMFLEHVLGVLPHGSSSHVSDGVAASGAVGAFGCVRAYLGPIETQGRGGLHPHMHVWVLQPMTAAFLARLRAGTVEGLAEKVRSWRQAVLEKVGSMQFDSVEEFGRQLSLRGTEELPPMPLSANVQRQARCDGGVEEDDLALLPAPAKAPRDAEWVRSDPPLHGPRRQRHFAPVKGPEPDPQEVHHQWPACRRVAQTGAHLCLQPQWRRKPPYVCQPDGSARMHFAEDSAWEARRWARCFGLDARLCFVRSHIHRCMQTCWKHVRKGQAKEVRICRFNFFQEYVTAAYRRCNPARRCKRNDCPMKDCKVVAGDLVGKPVHPTLCPSPPATVVEAKWHRRYKRCVWPVGAEAVNVREVEETAGELPRVQKRPRSLPVEGSISHEAVDDESGYLPHVESSERYNRLGRVVVLRYHPQCGSSNPCGQVLLRCNWDVQSCDRVPALDVVVEATNEGLAGARDSACGGIHEDAGLVGGGGFDDAEAEFMEEEEDAEDDVELQHVEDEEALGREDNVDEEAFPEQARLDPVARSLTRALASMFRDAADAAHYSFDYATKGGPIVGDLLHEEAVGVERRRAEDADLLKREGKTLPLPERARLTEIRLSTSANRAMLKKLPEMAFQMLYDHECYQSHETWTIFCKGAVALAFKAKHAIRVGKRSWEDVDDDDVEVDAPGDADEEEEGDVMDAQRDRGAFAVVVAPADRESVDGLAGGGTASRFIDDATSEDRGVDDEEDGEEEDAGEGAEDYEGGGEGKRKAGPEVVFKATRVQNLRTDWLHRGDREPLASMGLYHYAMFVYTARGDPLKYHWDDFVTYRFSDSHPSASFRVQKLRVGMPYRVPRLFGFTMPTVAKDAEVNALFKSVLFRPVSAEPQASCAFERVGESCGRVAAWHAYSKMLNTKGEFLEGWRAWFRQQVSLAETYATVQDRAGKMFTVEDVDMSLREEEVRGERGRPSVAEFLAQITVEVATNLDLSAEARGRPRGQRGPHAADFCGDEQEAVGTREVGEAREERDGVGMGEEVDFHDDECTGLGLESSCPVAHEDVRRVALFEDVHHGQKQQYLDSFMATYAPDNLPPRRKSSAPHLRGYTGLSAGGSFVDCRKAQRDLFKYKADDQQGRVPETTGKKEEEGWGVHGSGTDLPEKPVLLKDQTGDSPRGYAARLVAEAAKAEESIVFNDEQLDVIALVVGKVEEILEAGWRPGMPREEKLQIPQLVLLLHGQGGTGKTEVVKLLRQVFQKFFCGGEVAMAASNSAARVVKGETIHAAVGLGASSTLRLDKMGRVVPARLIDKYADVCALIFEETSMIPPALLGAASWRICCAREKTFSVDPLLYTERGNMFGGIPIILFLGDFYQLEPVVRRGPKISLMRPLPLQASSEARNGQRLFLEGVTDALFLYKTHRFVDRLARPRVPCPFLPEFLQGMREGRKLTPNVWRTVRSWEVRGGGHPRLSEPGVRDGYEMAIGWQAVARMMQYRAVRDAAEARQILMYVQAVDVSKFALPQGEYERMLLVVNMNDTGKLLPMLPLYDGMRVRFTMKLSAKHQVVQDAVGTVVGVEFHIKEFDLPGSDWRDNRSHSAYECGYVRLRYFPRAVLVRVDGYDEDVGYGKGVVMVHVHKGPWKYSTHHVVDGERKPWTLDVQRYQLPLAPEKVRTVQTAQGLGMDGARMHFAKPPGNMSPDEYWLHVYVMLSRVRVEKRIVAYDLPPKELFEKGPPAFVRQGVGRFEDLMRRVTWESVRAARSRLGWPRVERPQDSEAVTETPAARFVSQNTSGDLGQTDSVRAAGTAPRSSPRGGKIQDGVGARQDLTSYFDDPDGDDFFGRCEDEDLQSDLAELASRSVMQEEFEALGGVSEAPVCSTSGAAASSPGGRGAADGSDRGHASDGVRQRCGDGQRAQSSSRQEPPLPPPPNPPERKSSASATACPEIMASFAMSPTVPVSEDQLRLLEPAQMDFAHLLYGTARDALSRDIWVTSDERFVGLANSGRNLCFANAVLQLLFRIRPFRSIVLRHDHVGGDVWRCRSCALKVQFEGMMKKARDVGGVLAVDQVGLSVRKGTFGAVFKGNAMTGGGRQCDATEFLEAAMGANDGCEHDRLCDLLGSAHPALVFRATACTAVRSVMLDNIWGIVSRSRLRCQRCARVSDSLVLDPYLDLDVVGTTARSLGHLLA